MPPGEFAGHKTRVTNPGPFAEKIVEAARD